MSQEPGNPLGKLPSPSPQDSREPLLTALLPPAPRPGFSSMWRPSGQRPPGPLSPWLQPRVSHPDPDTRPQPHLHMESGSAMLSCHGGSGFKIDHAGPTGLSPLLQGHCPRNLSCAVDRSVLSARLRSTPHLTQDNRKPRKADAARMEKPGWSVSSATMGVCSPPPSAPRARLRAQ